MRDFVLLFLFAVAVTVNWVPSQAFMTPKQQRPSSALPIGFLEEVINFPASANFKKKNLPKLQVPADLAIPDPQPLSIPHDTDLVDFAKSSLAFALRLGTGAFVLGWKVDSLFYTNNDESSKYSLKLGPLSIRDSSSVLQDAPRPKEPLILYEYDASPFCKRVRETLNLLDLTVEYRPCPGARQGKFSKELSERTGRQTVPYLIDPNTQVELFESSDQIEYLLQTYGPSEDSFDRKALWPITFEAFSVFTSTLVAILRGFPGAQRQANALPENEDRLPLELWGYESSPFVRPVREALSSLCLPHVMISAPRGSANRDRRMQEVASASSSIEETQFQVPFLRDPNTGIELYESTAIVKYLQEVYTTP